ncbi:MAG: hypothetical protein PHQ23_04400 [Candidatus Wallbacteria bacterium]|nr:hypothetical protein [Candidatus Wallbacteria bacterium]
MNDRLYRKASPGQSLILWRHAAAALFFIVLPVLWQRGTGAFPYPVFRIPEQLIRQGAIYLYQGEFKGNNRFAADLSVFPAASGVLASARFIPAEFRPLTETGSELEFYRNRVLELKIKMDSESGFAHVITPENVTSWLINPEFMRKLRELDIKPGHRMRIVQFSNPDLVPDLMDFLADSGITSGRVVFDPFNYYLYHDEPIFQSAGEMKIKVFHPASDPLRWAGELSRFQAWFCDYDIGREARLDDFQRNVIDFAGRKRVDGFFRGNE